MDISFDFGSKPAAEGYIKVTGKTIYNEELGYGLSKKAQAVLRSSGEKDVMRDFLIMHDNTFRVKMPNGFYKIR
ncbi:MAG: GDSL family lipase, partial [Firmicutes bacterium]|nr:GDSL family lipase [Bacillota bacterium]